MMSFIADPLAQLRCCYCQEDITGLRIRCVECRDFDICLQCFACGAEIGTHKNDHDYQFMESGSFTIFAGSNAWTAREELRLLDAIEQFGYGNWEDISKHIETKNPQETKDEFCAMYIHGNMGQALWPNTMATHISKDHTSQYTGPLSPSLTSKLPPVDVTFEDSAQLGYMPLRDDFEREFDNDGENTVSHLSITNEDEDIDIALKLAHVDMYTRKLRERARRKRIARDYHLVEQFFIQRKQKEMKESGRKRGLKADKEIEDKVRPFTQFHTPQEHEEFLKGLKKERDLKIRIRELIRYRRNGLTTQTECVEYEAERYYREQRKENRRKGNHPDPGNLRTVPSSIVAEKERRNPSSPERRIIKIIPFGDENSSASPFPCQSYLSGKEKKICLSLKLKPAEYITYKTLALQDCFDRQNGIESHSSPLSGLHHLLVRELMKFWTSCGWITAS